jgi:hypothetical protein
MSETSTLISCTGTITRAELAKLPTPAATATHLPIPHTAVVETLIETLSHRHIGVVGEEFAVSSDAMEMFGVLDLETSFQGCRFAIGIRNANNKRFRLACTVGLRVFVCHNLAFRGDYSPVLAKHSKHFSLEDALSIGVDRMQRNFDPMRQQVERWRAQQLSAEEAKLTIYRAFIEGGLDVPKYLARRVHELYFNLVTGTLRSCFPTRLRLTNDGYVLVQSGSVRRLSSADADRAGDTELSAGFNRWPEAGTAIGERAISSSISMIRIS